MLTAGRRDELRAFLQSRRARIRPEDVGLPHGAKRRVPGLRREEVAALAGVGVTWYTMFESGTAHGVSADVVDSVGRALRLSVAEMRHLRLLIAEGDGLLPGNLVPDELFTTALAFMDAPAYVMVPTWDIIAWNDAYAFVWNVEPPGSPPYNALLRTFVDGVYREMHGDNWSAFPSSLVAMYRSGLARFADDERYTSLAQTLRDDPAFAEMWERHDVVHPLATTTGDVESPRAGRFRYRVLNLKSELVEGQTLVVQVPDEESARRLRAARSKG